MKVLQYSIVVLLLALTASCASYNILPVVGKVSNVEMTPLPGVKGYSLTGPQGFAGQLARGEDGIWRLEGTFHFETGGYAVGEPVIRSINATPQRFIITIPYDAPPENASVTQAITEAPVALEVKGQEDARFTITIQRSRG